MTERDDQADEFEPPYERWPGLVPIIGSVAEGYPCPKDDTTLTLIKGGAWCTTCHTVWHDVDDVSLADLDALPETTEEP